MQAKSLVTFGFLSSFIMLVLWHGTIFLLGFSCLLLGLLLFFGFMNAFSSRRGLEGERGKSG